MKYLLLLLLASLTLTSCKDILGIQRGDYTFTGILYKDCNRTPIANAKIVYTTFRGTGLSPITRSFESTTDANGSFSIKEISEDLKSITIELASTPDYKAGPEIARADAGPISNDTVYNFGELYYAKRGVDVGGDADYGAKLKFKIDPYFQQFDSLIIGRLPFPLILSPVPQSYEYTFFYVGSEDFVKPLSVTDGLISWCTSVDDYNKRLKPPVGANIFERRIEYTLCNQGDPIEFSVDTLSRAR